MTQRISLNQGDFQKLVRGEIVSQGDLQVALQDVGLQQIFADVYDALVGIPPQYHPMLLKEDDEEIRRWIHGVNGPDTKDGFLQAFAAAVCRADRYCYSYLRPALLALKARFPQYRFEGVL